MVYIYALIEMVQAHPNWKELFGGAEAETGQIQPRGYSAQGFHFAGGISWVRILWWWKMVL